VGHPRQGVPVGGVTGREGPAYSLDGDSILDRLVLCYVNVIVIVDESMISDLPKYNQGDHGQKKIDYENLFICRHSYQPIVSFLKNPLASSEPSLAAVFISSIA
jgi:hypothetical protein